MATRELDPRKVAEIADKAIGYLSGAGVAALVYLGDRLGLYGALRESGPSTSAELAARARLHERWVREWLHGQASAGLVRYAGDGRLKLTGEQAGGCWRTKRTPPSLAAASHSSFRSFSGGRAIRVLPNWPWRSVQNSARTMPWERAIQQPGCGRTSFPSSSQAWTAWHQARRGAKIADVGCGSGKALLKWPGHTAPEFHGYDSSELAIRFVKRTLPNRASAMSTSIVSAAGSLPSDASSDSLTWDCVHDMTDPAGAMRSIRAAIKPDGTWLIVDINGMPTPEENYPHPLSGLLYSISVLDCLACSTYEEGGAGLGTLGLPEPVAREMTAAAGFTRFSVRDFGNPLNSFYEVRP